MRNFLRFPYIFTLTLLLLLSACQFDHPPTFIPDTISTAQLETNSFPPIQESTLIPELSSETSPTSLNPENSDSPVILFVTSDPCLVKAVSVTGGDSKTLTTTPPPYDCWRPKFSPDGKKLAFILMDGQFDLYVMNLDGSDLTRVADAVAFAWSPDSSQLVYKANDPETQKGQIEIVNVDGENAHNIRMYPFVPLVMEILISPGLPTANGYTPRQILTFPIPALSLPTASKWMDPSTPSLVQRIYPFSLLQPGLLIVNGQLCPSPEQERDVENYKLCHQGVVLKLSRQETHIKQGNRECPPVVLLFHLPPGPQMEARLSPAVTLKEILRLGKSFMKESCLSHRKHKVSIYWSIGPDIQVHFFGHRMGQTLYLLLPRIWPLPVRQTVLW
jgi:hypothetical protein